MNDCCKETYKLALNEVLIFIKYFPEITTQEIIKSLEYASEMINKKEKS